MYEPVNDLTRIVLIFDLFVEVEEYVRVIRYCLVKIELESLSYGMFTFFNSFSGDFLLESRFTVTILD